MTKPAEKPLRELMPETAAFIDALREAFGAEVIDPSIRAGIKDKLPTFWASENGYEIGTKAPEPGPGSISLAQTIVGPMSERGEQQKGSAHG